MKCITEIDRNPATGLKVLNHALRASNDRLEAEGVDHFLDTIVRHAVEIGGASAGWLAMGSADETQLKVAALVPPNDGTSQPSNRRRSDNSASLQ